MTQVNGKRDYKHAYKLQKKTGETEDPQILAGTFEILAAEASSCKLTDPVG